MKEVVGAHSLEDGFFYLKIAIGGPNNQKLRN